MKESFIHYVWRAKRFNLKAMKSTQDEPIQIVHFGHYNTDSGPDFKNAQVRIGDTLWVGHIEMHLLSSHWIQHKHSSDPAYENVILHVVMDEDVPVFHQNGTRIPCLILKDRIHQQVIQNYERLQYQESWIACQKHIEQVHPTKVNLWLDRMLLERLDEKSKKLEQILIHTNHDWEESFYICLARSFGLNKNGPAFESLAANIPLRILNRHRDQPFQIEAILFGCAGLLNGSFVDDYPIQLKEEFKFLKQKYQLKEINPVMWQFFRMRPVNFPPIRIAQFASLLVKTGELLKYCMEARTTKELIHWFGSVQAGEYWNTHYHFHKKSPEKIKVLGHSFLHLMLINTIAPFFYLYGSKRKKQVWIDRAIDWVASIEAEKNKIIRNWKSIGLSVTHAGHSQGLIHLKRQYCDKKACLNCGIGHQIMSLSDNSGQDKYTIDKTTKIHSK